MLLTALWHQTAGVMGTCCLSTTDRGALHVQERARRLCHQCRLAAASRALLQAMQIAAHLVMGLQMAAARPPESPQQSAARRLKPQMAMAMLTP